MSFHPLGLLVFVFLTVCLVLLFAAGLCERKLRQEETQAHPHDRRAPASTMH
jgi:hypothetical protein